MRARSASCDRADTRHQVNSVCMYAPTDFLFLFGNELLLPSMIEFIWVASAWQYLLHYHALVYTAGTDSGLPYGTHDIWSDCTVPCSTDAETGL